jgi:hypothetical protein
MDEMLTDLSGRMRPPHPAPPVEAIIARGQRLRTRRRAITGTAALGATALGATLTLTPPAVPAASPHASASAPSVAQMDLAAWSVHANPDTTVTVTVHELFDADHLRDALARAGVRAVVQFNGPDCAHVQQLPANIKILVGVPALRHVNGAVVFTINRAEMPPGSVLSLYLSYDKPAQQTGTASATQQPITIAVALLSGYPDCATPRSTTH